MRTLDLLRQAKHQAWLMSKAVERSADKTRDLGYRLQSSTKQFKYDPSRYPLDFVTLPVPERSGPIQARPPRIIWCVWSGTNEMSQNRSEALRSIRRMNADLDVILVSPQNLKDYVSPDSPLHPSYEHLSDVHKSDYLHAYLMHHHGGGFTGIKKHPHSWLPVFEQSERDGEAWVTGYTVPSSKESASFHGPLGKDVRRQFGNLPGFSGKIVRANSPITHEWWLEINRRVDYYSTLLALAPGNDYGTNEGYPVPWTKLGSQIFEPLCLKYQKHIRFDQRLKPQLWGHR